jgi:ELWxxDGT repeat protein
LWATDGTVANTVQISDMCLDLGHSISVNNTLLFMAQAPNNTYDLWRSDGSIAGTIRIYTGFTSGNEGYSPMFMLTDRANAYLRIYGKEGCELWKSDGTPEGTFVLYKSCPTQVGAAGGALYFITQQNEREIALWRSDGTPAGTVQITIVQ